MSEISRRTFLSSTGAALAASAVLPSVTSFTNTSKAKIRHAVIGTGGQGSSHCRTLAKMTDLVEVVAVCDVDPIRRAKLPLSSQILRVSSSMRISGSCSTTRASTP